MKDVWRVQYSYVAAGDRRVNRCHVQLPGSRRVTMMRKRAGGELRRRLPLLTPAVRKCQHPNEQWGSDFRPSPQLYLAIPATAPVRAQPYPDVPCRTPPLSSLLFFFFSKLTRAPRMTVHDSFTQPPSPCEFRRRYPPPLPSTSLQASESRLDTTATASFAVIHPFIHPSPTHIGLSMKRLSPPSIAKVKAAVDGRFRITWRGRLISMSSSTPQIPASPDSSRTSATGSQGPGRSAKGGGAGTCYS
jgi:hypothetical protein